MSSKQYAKRTTSVDRVTNALLLLEFEDFGAVRESVAKWTPNQRAKVYEWTAREILYANDNYDVRRLKTPKVIEKLREKIGPVKF